jgi:ribosome modulation factor
MITENKAFLSAREKGRDARRRGEPKSACPYRDKRGLSGHVTFSRAFLKAWLEGWEEAAEAAGGDDESEESC